MKTGYHTGLRGGNVAFDITRRIVLQIGGYGRSGGVLRPVRTLQNYTLWARSRCPAPRGRHPYIDPQPGPNPNRSCRPTARLNAVRMASREDSKRGPTRRALDALGQAQWTIACTLHRVDELTALLGASFRLITKSEAKEHAALAELEAIAATPDGFVDILRRGAWSDTSRRSAAPLWWPTLPDGWRLVAAKVLTCEHVRSGELRMFECAAHLVEFCRGVSSSELPSPPWLRVRPRVRRRRSTGTEGGDGRS